MSSRYQPGSRRFRSHHWDDRDWARWHAERRAEVSSRFFGLDSEVTALFFRLSPSQLRRVFESYGREHGRGARAYAEKTYPEWRTGLVNPSAETLYRLLDCVPPVLPLSEKAALVAQLRRRSRRPRRVELRCSLNEIDTLVPLELAKLFREALTHSIPDDVRGALGWLTTDSSRAVEGVLRASEAVEACWLEAAARAETRRLHDAAERALLLPGSLTHAFSHLVETPYCVLRVTVTRGNTAIANPSNQEARPMSDLTPHRPDDLMGELTKGLSESEKQELRKVAAREQLALEAKAREGSLRHAASGAELDRAIEAAERLQYGEKSSGFTLSGSYRGASGTTSVEVKRSEATAVVFKYVAIGAGIVALLYAFLQ
jgi:hypothetical protein